MSTTSRDLALRLQRGDRKAAFRMKQIRRGKKSAEVMRARGFPNLKKAWEKRRARLMNRTQCFMGGKLRNGMVKREVKDTFFANGDPI